MMKAFKIIKLNFVPRSLSRLTSKDLLTVVAEKAKEKFQSWWYLTVLYDLRRLRKFFFPSPSTKK